MHSNQGRALLAIIAVLAVAAVSVGALSHYQQVKRVEREAEELRLEAATAEIARVSAQMAATDAETRRQRLAAVQLEQQQAADEQAAGDLKMRAANAKAIGDLRDVYARWKDAETVAFSTGRIALATPIANLQAIRRDALALEIPECLNDTRAVLTAGMQGTIDGMITFMGNENKIGDYLAQPLIRAGQKKLREYESTDPTCSR